MASAKSKLYDYGSHRPPPLPEIQRKISSLKEIFVKQSTCPREPTSIEAMLWLMQSLLFKILLLLFFFFFSFLDLIQREVGVLDRRVRGWETSGLNESAEERKHLSMTAIA